MSVAEARITTHPPVASTHAFMRAGERWGVTLTDADFGRMVMLIEREDVRATRLYPRPQWNGHVQYAVFHRDRWFPVVYAPATRMIVTVLPPRVLEPYRERLERLRAEVG